MFCHNNHSTERTTVLYISTIVSHCYRTGVDSVTTKTVPVRNELTVECVQLPVHVGHCCGTGVDLVTTNTVRNELTVECTATGTCRALLRNRSRFNHYRHSTERIYRILQLWPHQNDSVPALLHYFIRYPYRYGIYFLQPTLHVVSVFKMNASLLI
jgi:hypothetical protein